MFLPEEHHKNNKTVALGLALLTMLALALRLHHLDYESLFMDELRQVSIYKETFSTIIRLAMEQTNPPLDYLIGAVFYRISESDFSVRLPAVLFGTASVALITLYTRKLFNWGIGIFTGLLLALSPYHIYFSQEARPYAITTLLFISVLYLIQKILGQKAPSARHYVFLFIVVCAFLFTRTLAPMISVAVLLGYSSALYVLKKRNTDLSQKYRNISLLLLLSLIVYLPAFLYIYFANERYLIESVSLTDRIAHGAMGIKPSTVWYALNAQAGFLSLFILASALLYIFNIWRHGPSKNKASVNMLIIILPLLIISQLFLYHANTAYFFRPPYAIYLLPLSLFLIAYAINEIWGLCHTVIRQRIFMLLPVTLIVLQAYAAYDFKGMRIKSDWRGLTQHLSTYYGENYLLISETLSSTDTWHPGFYGFPRYYRGSSIGILLSEVFSDINEIKKSPMAPVLVLFYYRNHYLSHLSTAGIFPLGVPDPEPLSTKPRQHDIQVIDFTGFSVTSLSNPSGDLAKDMAKLFKHTLNLIQQDSSATELKLAIALLENGCHNQIEAEFFHAIRISARNSQLRLINEIETMLLEANKQCG